MKRRNPRWQKPVTPAREFERRKAALPPMPTEERDAAIRRIGRELGISEEVQNIGYAGI
jgi:hypothetical protein